MFIKMFKHEHVINIKIFHSTKSVDCNYFILFFNVESRGAQHLRGECRRRGRSRRIGGAKGLKIKELYNYVFERGFWVVMA